MAVRRVAEREKVVAEKVKVAYCQTPGLESVLKRMGERKRAREAATYTNGYTQMDIDKRKRASLRKDTSSVDDCSECTEQSLTCPGSGTPLVF